MTEHEVRCSDPEKGKILIVVSLVLLGGDQDLLQPRLRASHRVHHTQFLFSAGLGLREPGTAFQVTGTRTLLLGTVWPTRKRYFSVPVL